MIPPLAGWAWREVAGSVVLSHGDAEIRYTERGATPAPLDEIIERVLGEVAEVGTPERLFTREGESAVIVRARGRVHVVIGLVLAEDFVTVTRGTTAGNPAELEHAVRHLVTHDVLMLGRRARRAVHDGPAGWEVIERGLRVDWVNPGFPAEPAAITVWPAMPVEAIDAAPITAPAFAAVERVRTARGLEGATWRWSLTPELRREVAVLRHGPYVYAARLDCRACDAAPHVAAFYLLLESLRAIPLPERRAPHNPLSHWID